jgi:predicted nucleotidyltransferase
MTSRKDIRAFVDQVVTRFRPSRVILFGSHAYGHPTADSDVDLMVVMPHRGPAARAATRIRLACPRGFPMDLIVRSEPELKKGAAEKDWFIVEVLEKGIVLHDRADRAMGAKGRSRLRRRLAVAPVAQIQPL